MKPPMRVMNALSRLLLRSPLYAATGENVQSRRLDAEAAPRGGLVINKGSARRFFNAAVGALLRSPLHGLLGFDRFGMLLTYTGRKSGQRYTLPLAYMRDGEIVTTFALFTNTVWWKNLRDGGAVKLRLKGRDLEGVAEVIEDPEEVADGLLRMAASNPGQSRRGYYAIPRAADGRPDHAALIREARTRVRIRIHLKEGYGAAGREFSPLAGHLFRAFVKLHALVYRLSGGRVGRRIGAGSAVLLLTTKGRKTGKRRTLPLSYFEDGDNLVVVGAMGGAPKHPAWVHNLRSNPRAMVQVGSAQRGMLAREAQGIERRRLRSMLNARSSAAFEGMQEKTTREFPVIVLSLASAFSGA